MLSEFCHFFFIVHNNLSMINVTLISNNASKNFTLVFNEISCLVIVPTTLDIANVDPYVICLTLVNMSHPPNRLANAEIVTCRILLYCYCHSTAAATAAWRFNKGYSCSCSCCCC